MCPRLNPIVISFLIGCKGCHSILIEATQLQQGLHFLTEKPASFCQRSVLQVTAAPRNNPTVNLSVIMALIK